MHAATQGGTIALSVPSHPRMMLVIRLTTAGVVARAGLSMDALEDVKLAIEEACNCMMQNSRCEELDVSYTLGNRGIEIRLRGKGENAACRERVDDDEMRVVECILKSMVDEVSISGAEGELFAIDMCKYLPA